MLLTLVKQSFVGFPPPVGSCSGRSDGCYSWVAAASKSFAVLPRHVADRCIAVSLTRLGPIVLCHHDGSCCHAVLASLWLFCLLRTPQTVLALPLLSLTPLWPLSVERSLAGVCLEIYHFLLMC